MSQQKKTSIGGQALLEGIIMRGPEVTTMAVRDPDGKMIMEKFPTKGKERAGFFRLPFIRGIFNMYDSLTFGYKCLMRSAEIAGLEEEDKTGRNTAQSDNGKAEECAVGEEVETAECTAEIGSNETAECAAEIGSNETAECAAEIGSNETAECAAGTGNGEAAKLRETAEEAPQDNAQRDCGREKKPKSAARERTENIIIMSVSVVLGLALAIGLFIYLPSLITKWLSGAMPFLENQIWRSVFEGVIRIIIFIGYMCCMLLMKDIRRTYMYHGAEHKTIFCYENGLPLTVENVRKQSRFHPRCGTSFMILMLLVGILISMFITTPNPLLRTVIKLACLPITVSVGYELIKLAGRYDNILTRIISAPGKWLQRITTIEPDDSMIECAIAAFNEVVPHDGSDEW